MAGQGDPCDVCGGPIGRGSGPRKRCSPECRRIGHNRTQRAGYASDPDRHIAYVQDYVRKHPDKYKATLAKRPKLTALQHRRRNLKAFYGLTLDQYDAMVEAQDGLCAICRRPETGRIRGRLKPLAVDHDHDTGHVRGLLCSRCNSVLGFFENCELFDAATAYLGRYALAESRG